MSRLSDLPGKKRVGKLIDFEHPTLQGDRLPPQTTQGAALGYELLPLQGVLLWAFGPSGRAAYMGFLAFWALLGNFNHTEGRAAVDFWAFACT